MKINKIFFMVMLCVIISVIFNVTAFGADYWAEEKKNFKATLEKAERGDVNTQFDVAYKYLFGSGGADISTKKALEWYEKAANNNHAGAQNELGVLYAKGWFEIKKDSKKACEWLLKSASLKNGIAFANLGWMYMKGIGVNVDYKKAIDYYTQGANLGEFYSMLNLGWMYSQGMGVNKDEKKAREWYDKAARIGDKNTSDHGEYVRLVENYNYEYSYKLNQNFEYNLKRAETGNTASMSNLGDIYIFGYDNVSKDSKKAFEWYEKAAALGDSGAFFILGWIYERGNGVNMNFSKARTYYEKAEALGNISALSRLGELYEVVFKDYNKALEYYEKAASQKAYNLPMFKFWGLGWMFENKSDYKMAFRCYTNGEKTGDPYCTMELGRMYENGLGTVKDLNKAVELYRKASEGGSMQAKKALARLNASTKDDNLPEKKNAQTKKTVSSKKNNKPEKNTAVAKKNSSSKKKVPEKKNASVPLKQNSETKNQKQPVNIPLPNNNIQTMTTNNKSIIKPRIAVYGFSDKSEEGKAPASAIMDMMTSELFKTGNFMLLERERLDDMAKEQKLSQSGLVDTSTTIKLGRIIGAQYIVTGAITLYYYSEKASGFALPVIGISSKAKTAYVVLDIRIYDAETSEIVYAYNHTGEATNKEKKSIGSSDKMIGGLLELATRNAVEKHVSAMKVLNLQI